MRQSIRIKMCGMKHLRDIQQASALGVDAIGLIFFAGSPRAITVIEAKKLLEDPPLFLNIVAVFVNPSKEEVLEVIQQLPVHYLQFHGDESSTFCRQFGIPYIKSVSVRTETDFLQAMENYPDASAILLDAYNPGKHGGSGETFNWRLIPHIRHQAIILAGGLNPQNVQEAIDYIQPDAVDVCSGVETSPGLKDYNKMRAFTNAIRGT